MKFEITAKRLRIALDRNNMKAQELAEKSKLGKSSISHYVNGTHKPSNISSKAMADVLGVSPLWLMGFDVPMMAEIDSQLFAPNDADIDARISNDKELKDIIKIYYSLSEEKRAEIRRYIKFISMS